MITYKWEDVGNNRAVFLDDRRVGTIKRIGTYGNDFKGWQYFPKGKKDGGEIFKSLSDCEDSLNKGD